MNPVQGIGLTDTQAAWRAFEYQSWERAASEYDTSFAPVTAPFAAPLIDAVGCRAGDRVLDLACGTAHIARVAADRGARSVAADFSLAMLRAAGRHDPALPRVAADGRALPFRAAAFDAVVAGFGLHHFPAPPQALAEVRRVLRPGGRIAFSAWSADDNMFQQVLLEAMQRNGAARAALPPTPHNDLVDGAACTALLSRCGFAEITVRKLAVDIAVASAAQLVDMTARGTARGAAALRAQPDGSLAGLLRLLDGLLARWRTPDGAYAVPAVAFIAAGVSIAG